MGIMKSIFKRLWFPTEQDSTGARYIYHFLLPILLLWGIFFKDTILPGILILSSFILRAIIIVRSSLTHPINLNFDEKYRRITSRKRKWYGNISLILPVLSLVILLITPNHFYIAFSLAVFLSFSMLSYSVLSNAQFILLSMILLLSSMLIVRYQGGLGALMVCIIISILIIPEALSTFLKMKRLDENSTS
jgi:hypothetical protein